jgi:cation transport ATPase
VESGGSRFNGGHAAGTGVLGNRGPLIAAVMHNVSTLAVMGNAGRLLKFQELLS